MYRYKRPVKLTIQGQYSHSHYRHVPTYKHSATHTSFPHTTPPTPPSHTTNSSTQYWYTQLTRTTFLYHYTHSHIHTHTHIYIWYIPSLSSSASLPADCNGSMPYFRSSSKWRFSRTAKAAASSWELA